MKLIVGLGNPGNEYKNTRHNLGSQALDFLANKLNLKWKKEKFKGLYAVGTYLDQKIVLLKPLTGINNSGECIWGFVNYFQIPLADILIIYDDLTLPLGTFRYRQQGSNGGHNGIKSIIKCLGTQKIKRLKIGIGYNKNVSWSEWVLQKFSPSETETLRETISLSIHTLLENWNQWLGEN
jgi:PTH1 family peptidyl-tRNA hydrolase